MKFVKVNFTNLQAEHKIYESEDRCNLSIMDWFVFTVNKITLKNIRSSIKVVGIAFVIFLLILIGNAVAQHAVTGAFQGDVNNNQTGDPVLPDYDGDGRTDMTVYRNGVWYLLNSKDGFSVLGFGLPSDTPIAGSFMP